MTIRFLSGAAYATINGLPTILIKCSAWVDIAGVIITIFGAVFGFFYGRAMDAKDALSDF